MLFLYALPPGDKLRLQLELDDADAAAIKAELTALANDKVRLPDEEVRQLCDMIAVYAKDHICWNKQLGSLAEHFLSSKDKVMAKHLRARLATYKSMRVFIYGHTHQYENPWPVDLDIVRITVANTGAFQRLIDEKGFLNRLNGRTPEEALRTMRLDELPPCYTAVIVAAPISGQAPPAPKSRAWYMREDGPGVLTSPEDGRCH
jgi:hypothetical protein